MSKFITEFYLAFPKLVLQATDGCSQKVHVEGYIPQNVVTHKNIQLLTSGDSTGLSAEGITGRVLLILTEAISLLAWALLVAMLVLTFCCTDGNHLSVHLTIYNLLFAVW